MEQAISFERLQRVLFWVLVLAVLLIAASTALGGMGIPTVSNLVTQVRNTVVYPVGFCVFSTGAVQCAANVWKSGGIQGLSDGGLKTAGAGLMIGGIPWLGTQMGVSGGLVL